MITEAPQIIEENFTEPPSFEPKFSVEEVQQDIIVNPIEQQVENIPAQAPQLLEENFIGIPVSKPKYLVQEFEKNTEEPMEIIRVTAEPILIENNFADEPIATEIPIEIILGDNFLNEPTIQIENYDILKRYRTDNNYSNELAIENLQAAIFKAVQENKTSDGKKITKNYLVGLINRFYDLYENKRYPDILRSLIKKLKPELFKIIDKDENKFSNLAMRNVNAKITLEKYKEFLAVLFNALNSVIEHLKYVR